MVRVFLVTANVGSVFEDLETRLMTWMNGFISEIKTKDPEFVAIHFQETGGKNWGEQNGSNCVNQFFGQLAESMGQIGFTRAEGFVDSRSELEDQFTALSSVYFVHESVQPHAVAIWDFQEKCFKEVSSPKIHIGTELDLTSRKQKEKFPLNYYPNGKWARKGFLKTRWQIDGHVMDFVNVHLFHDSDNLIAASSFPSQFAQTRAATLNYMINRLLNGDSSDGLFIFGDFNYRLNTQGVMEELSKDFEESSVTFGTKAFNCPELELRFLHSFDWVKKYDFELQQQKGALEEFDINFHPTYPFEEDVDQPEKFLRTRCPAWCDRVLFVPKTKTIMSQESPIEYNIIGSKVCMGDHKPVYLSFTLAKSNHSSDCTSSNCHGQNSTEGRFTTKKSPSLSISSNNSNATNSTHGTCQSSIQSNKCKCLAFSLFKCNLSFPKCKKVSVSSDSMSINPKTKNSSSNSSESPGGHKFSKSFYSINNASKPWRIKRNDKVSQQEILDNNLEALITDKPTRQTDQQSQIILPISFQVSEKDNNKEMMEVAVNIQNLNVISSMSDKSSLGCNCSTNKALESSKLPFGWTNYKRKTHVVNNTINNDNSSSKSNSHESTKTSSLCAKCVIL